MPLCVYLQLQYSTLPLEIHLIKIQHILYKLLNGIQLTMKANAYLMMIMMSIIVPIY